MHKAFEPVTTSRFEFQPVDLNNYTPFAVACVAVIPFNLGKQGDQLIVEQSSADPVVVLPGDGVTLSLFAPFPDIGPATINLPPPAVTVRQWAVVGFVQKAPNQWTAFGAYQSGY